MNANDVIECYVTDVAVHLPRKRRNDVAFELRALIDEGLRDRAEAAGRGVDAAMATEFLSAFGQPADVAARYRPAPAIVDPADARSFLRATVIGLAIIWSGGLLVGMRQPIESTSDFLRAVGHWWGTTVVPSLSWPGLLVLGFGGAAWARRRWPHAAHWRPRDPHRIHGTRATLVLGVVGILCGLFVMVEPSWLLDVLYGGQAAAAAYEAFTYAETFRRVQGPLLFALILLNVPILVAVIVRGRWSTTLRRLQLGLGLATCAVMAWVVMDGPVLMTTIGDGWAKLAMGLSIAFTLVSLGVDWFRTVKPAPHPQVPVSP